MTEDKKEETTERRTEDTFLIVIHPRYNSINRHGC